MSKSVSDLTPSEALFELGQMGEDFMNGTEPNETPYKPPPTLDDHLDSTYVGVVDESVIECQDGLLEAIKGWYFLGDDASGIIAYFKSSNDAYRARLDWINRKLNP